MSVNRKSTKVDTIGGAEHMSVTKTCSALAFDQTPIEWIELGKGDPLIFSAPIGLPYPFFRCLLEGLSTQHTVVFIKRRALWGTALPITLDNVGVMAHARDVARVAATYDDTRLSIMAYCSGIPAVLEALPLLARPPYALTLLSGRYGPSPAVLAREVADKLARKPQLQARVIDILVKFAPLDIRELLARELQHPGCLEAHLRALEDTRSYRYMRLPEAETPTLLVTSERDYREIISGTDEYAARFVRNSYKRLTLPEAEHFYPHDNAAALIALLRNIN